MARGINKVILIGNIGQDPEVRHMPSGGAVTNVSIATSETWKDKNTGQPQERTEWHRVVFFNRLGEIAGEYLKKGAKIYVEGSLRTRKWQAEDGSDRYTTEIVASEMQMLDGRDSGAERAPAENASAGAQNNAPVNNGQQNANRQQGGAQPQQNRAQQAHRPAPETHSAPPVHHADPIGYDPLDDDIPF